MNVLCESSECRNIVVPSTAELSPGLELSEYRTISSSRGEEFCALIRIVVLEVMWSASDSLAIVPEPLVSVQHMSKKHLEKGGPVCSSHRTKTWLKYHKYIEII